MKTETQIDILNRDIFLLKKKQAEDFTNLKEQLNITYQSITPINFIKSVIEDATHSPDLKDGIGKAAIGMASGFLLKKLVFGSSINPIKKIASIAFQALITNVAAKNSDKIKDTGMGIFEIAKSLLIPKKKETIASIDKSDTYDFGEK